MSVELQTSEPMLEDYISAQRAAALMSVSPATFKRYHRYGFHGVFLETRKIGGRRFTTRVWIAEFIAKVNGTAIVTDVFAVEEARERLRAAGILPLKVEGTEQ